MFLVKSDLSIVFPAIFVERMAGKTQARRKQSGDGAFPYLHGTNQYDDHRAANDENSQMRVEDSMSAPEDTITAERPLTPATPKRILQ